jgi:hypothetical protein
MPGEGGNRGAVLTMTGHKGSSSVSFEQTAWQAAAVRAIRIIGSKFFEERLTIATSLGHSSP